MIKSLTSPIERNKQEIRAYRWQVSVCLIILFVSSSLANIIFIRELNRLKFEAGHIQTIPLKPVVEQIIATGLYSLVVGAIIIFIGLWISARAKLAAPVLARLFSEKPVRELINWKTFLSYIGLAIVVAIILLGLFELKNYFNHVTALQERPSKLYYLLVSFVAGINEEIMYRLGLMSLIITAIQYFKKLLEPTNRLVWTGIILSGIVFGLIHFPITSNFFKITHFTIFVTMTGNLITGATFGWIYWRGGLLAAMASHVAFDITFHVIGSPFG
jgi:hypothetical protein